MQIELSRRGKSVWVDRHNIEAAAAWRSRIELGIERAKAFIFVLTPDSAQSAECLKELAVAIAANKRLIPVVFRDVDPALLDPALTEPNWVYFRQTDDPEVAIGKVVEALESDYAWRDAHTRLGTRAREWLGANRDASFLLRGTDLRRAEAWYSDRANHKEQPTQIQLEYIAAGRSAAGQRQLRLFGAVALALVVAIVLGILALVSRDEAVAASQRSESVALSDEAQSALQNDNVPLGIMLSLEARKWAATPQAMSAMANSAAQPLAFAAEPRTSLNGVAFSPAGKELAAAAQDGDVLLYQLSTGAVTVLHDKSPVNAVAFNRSGSVLASGVQDGDVFVYNLGTNQTTRLDDGSAVTSLAFGPDDYILASGDASGYVNLHSLAGGSGSFGGLDTKWQTGSAIS
ncbi:MAG TPA: TIR domain-containing protein, partial [Acidimicrobiales bacterium]|nr:TIR domain-containing protein [Acidimicrobiales bacterium]